MRISIPIGFALSLVLAGCGDSLSTGPGPQDFSAAVDATGGGDDAAAGEACAFIRRLGFAVVDEGIGQHE